MSRRGWHEVKIICIAGPSCSGKSTVAKNIAKLLNAPVLSLDNFYKRGYPEIHVDFEGEKIRTFERPELWDAKRLAETVLAIEKNGSVSVKLWFQEERVDKIVDISKSDYFVIEGFLLYVYPEIIDLADFMFYLDLPASKRIERRLSRGRKFDDSLAKLAVAEYEKYGASQKHTKGVLIIDAEQDVDVICKKIMLKIK